MLSLFNLTVAANKANVGMPMRLFLIMLSAVLVGCIAKPRGVYYEPSHPLGVASSNTCDANSNKIKIEIPLEEGVLLNASLQSDIEGSYNLLIHFEIAENKIVELQSDKISVSSSNSETKTYQVDEWKDNVLVGGKVIQSYQGMNFEYDKSFGGKFSIGELSENWLKISIPEFVASGSHIRLKPIEFKRVPGNVQWLPKLNC